MTQARLHAGSDTGTCTFEAQEGTSRVSTHYKVPRADVIAGDTCIS